MISSSTSGSNSKEFSVKNHDRLSHPLSFGKEHLCLCQDMETFSENTHSSLCSTRQHKGGRVIATQRGVALDLKEFQRLCKLKNKLCQEFSQQEASLPLMATPAPDPVLPPASEKTEDSAASAEVIQQCTSHTWRSRDGHTDVNLRFYYPHQDSLFQSSSSS